MWQTVDYKGNTVKWYEAELIERLKAECEETSKYYSECIQKNRENNGQLFDDEQMRWFMGRAHHANEIIRIIKSYEGER